MFYNMGESKQGDDMDDKVDFEGMIKFLLSKYEQREVVKMTGIAQPTISAVGRGASYKKPDFYSGRSLIKAYNAVIEKEKVDEVKSN